MFPKVYCKNRIKCNIYFKISNFWQFEFPMYIFISRIALFFRIPRKVYLEKQRWKSILTLFFHSSNLPYLTKLYHFHQGWDTLKWKNVDFGTWKFLCTFSIPKLHLFLRFIEGYILKNRDGNHIWSQLPTFFQLPILQIGQNLADFRLKINTFLPKNYSFTSNQWIMKMYIWIYIILVMFSQGELALSEVCVNENVKIATWNLTPLRNFLWGIW